MSGFSQLNEVPGTPQKPGDPKTGSRQLKLGQGFQKLLWWVLGA